MLFWNFQMRRCDEKTNIFVAKDRQWTNYRSLYYLTVINIIHWQAF
jgi:hypothetical protein